MIDPQAALIFVRVAEAKSFTVAAHQSGLSKGSISKIINKLEKQLNSKLLYRTTRNLSLTETGMAFLEQAQRMAEALAEAECAVADLEVEPRGTLRMSAPTNFGHRYLGPAVADYLARHPGVAIDLSVSDRFVDLIEEGYDLAIRIGSLRDSSLVARTLAPFDMIVSASPTYLAACSVPRRPAELAQHNCLIYTLATTAPDRWLFEDGSGRELAKVQGSLRSSNVDVLMSSAVAGLGILIAPDFAVADAVRARRLVKILPDYRVVNGLAAIHAVYPPSRRLSPKVRSFVDFLAARFGRPEWRFGASESPAPVL